MPPLKTDSWYIHILAYKFVTRSPDVEGYPWTAEFGMKMLEQFESRGETVDSIHADLSSLRPLDPHTSSWGAVQKTFGRVPPALEDYLRRLISEHALCGWTATL
jgi:hypothetical protein